MPPDLFSVALGAIRSDSDAVDRIAMNMANVLTPGFRRMRSDVPAFSEGLRLHAADVGMTATGARVDPRNGPLKMTGRPLDVALTGPGYLEVMTPSGPAWTRRGTLRIDAGGVLVGPGGHPLAGRHGSEIRLPSGSVRISPEGAIYDAQDLRRDSPVDYLKVVDATVGYQVSHRGEGLYTAPPEAMRAVVGDSTTVQQGALEASNVQAAEEMTDLVRTARHLEGVIRGVQTYDSMMGMAIGTLGEVR